MIEIKKLVSVSVNNGFLEGVAKKVLKGENKKSENLSIAFVSPKRIKELNKKYRKIEKETDVLSFGQIQKLKGKSQNFNSKLKSKKMDAEIHEEIGLGEIVICPAIIKKYAKENKMAFREELAKVLIHGILHLLGYDHGKNVKEATAMRKKEGEYFYSSIRK